MTAPLSPIVLPRLSHPDPAIQLWADQVVRVLQQEFQRLGSPANAGPYVVTNAAPSRTFDPTAATTPQLGQVLAALVLDLKAKGLLT